MNGWQPLAVWGAWSLVVLLLTIDVMLSVALVSARSLSHVALRRLCVEGGPRLAFLETLEDPCSGYVAAGEALRRLCLLGAVLIAVLIGDGLAWRWTLRAGAVLGTLSGGLLLEGVVARAVALWNPRGSLRATAFSLATARIVVYPYVMVLVPILRWIGQNQRLTDEQREGHQEEQVEALIEVGERSGLLEATEGQMMRGIVDLDETPVREIMTPRPDIVALPVDTLVSEARRLLLKAGHSRLPVYRESIDNVVGVLHSRDLFVAWEDKVEDQPISRYLRAATFVPESLSAANLLADMRQKSHLSMVVDEYGGIAGLVTLEDLLEEIVGEIRDEHDEQEESVHEDADGSYVINAAAHVDELEHLFGIEFEEREFDTVGGFVVYEFGRVPSAGEILEIRGLQVEVLQAERRRVHRVRIRALAQPDGAVEARGGGE